MGPKPAAYLACKPGGILQHGCKKKSPAILFYGNFEKCRAIKIFSYLLKATLSGDKMVILELSIQYRLHKNMLPKTAVFWKNRTFDQKIYNSIKFKLVFK